MHPKDTTPAAGATYATMVQVHLVAAREKVRDLEHALRDTEADLEVARRRLAVLEKLTPQAVEQGGEG